MYRLRQFLVGVLAFATALCLMAGMALAQEPGDASPDSPVGDVFTVNQSLVLILTGLVVPIVVGILSRPGLPAVLGVGLNGAVSAVATMFVQAISDDGSAILSQEWLLQAALVFGTSMATYLGVYRPIARDRGTTVAAATGPGLVGPRHELPKAA